MIKYFRSLVFLLLVVVVLFCFATSTRAQQVAPITAIDLPIDKIVEQAIEVSIPPVIVEEETIPFSDTINVPVTFDTKNKINDQLLGYETEIRMLAKLIYREARGVHSITNQAAVAWCVLNRFDNGNYGSSIKSVITRKQQFAWNPNTPVTSKFYNLAKDVVTRWLLEKEGFSSVGRILPSDYLFFAGRGGKNHFRKTYESRTYWDFSLESPYAN